MTNPANGKRRPTRSALGTTTPAATRPPDTSRSRKPPCGQPVRRARCRAAQPSQNAAKPVGKPRVDEITRRWQLAVKAGKHADRGRHQNP